MIKQALAWAGNLALRMAGVETGLTWKQLTDMIDGGTRATAGVNVNETTAFQNSAFYSGVTLLSATIGSMPVAVYEVAEDESRQRNRKHPLARILRRRANPSMSAMTCVETVQAHCLGWGDGYAEIQFDGAGQVAALHPIHPSFVTKQYAADEDGTLYYEVRVPGESAPKQLPQRRMLHIRAPLCYGLISAAREAIGLGLATERFGGTYFGNNTILGTVLEQTKDCRLSDTATDKFKADMKAGGLSTANRLALLPKGVTAKVLAVSPEVAQFLETRRFQVEEIARFLLMPPYLLRETTAGVSYASISVQSEEFYRFTLTPWIRRWEDELTHKLLAEEEQASSFIEFNTASLLRADLQTRYAAYAIGRANGWLAVNEIRRLENLPPVKGGDTYLEPLNMQPAGTEARRYAKMLRAILGSSKNTSA